MRTVQLLALLVVAGCTDADDTPFAALPLEGDFDVDVSAPVHVARDRYGIAHIDAETLADAAYVQGYVMAHDRLPQMDILRRFGAGTLGELFGALDPTVIDTDLEMRMHRMRPLATIAWAQLQARAVAGDQYDAEVVTLLQRFADGVNAYAQQIRGDDPDSAGIWVLDPNLLASFDPARFTPWDPIDSLVLGRFQAFALSYSARSELAATELYQGLRDTFTGDAERDGIVRDLVRFTPVGQTATIDGFPNVATDTGTRSDGSAPTSNAAPAPSASVATQPHVSPELLARARRLLGAPIHSGPLGALGPHAFMSPYAGSNNWAVGPDRTTTGHAMLATDQHLQLPNPSIFYPTHLRIRGLHVEGETGTDSEPLDLLGVTFPGIPGIILGTNSHVAWSGTVSEHDVNDIYAETISACGSGSCVAYAGTQVPIETFTESVGVGALGTPTQAPITAVYERVQHHGVILPEIDPLTHRLVPRTSATALSVKYTGYEPTYEIRALWQLARGSRTVDDAFRALGHFSYGSQNWTLIDRDDNVAWTTNAVVPDRDPAAYRWNITDRPDAAAPFFVLPGDGSAEWRGQVSARYVPHAIIRPGEATSALPFIVTANADPVGATFDGDPLNQPEVAGHPLYVGISYAAGVRHARIAERLLAGGTQIDSALLEDIQHDTYSTMGARLAPYLVAAIDGLASATAADVVAFRSALTTEQRAQLAHARDVLAGWTFATPTGLTRDGVPTGDAQSQATLVFNAWMHFFVEATIADEIAAATSSDVWAMGDTYVARIIHALITAPATFVQGASGEPVVCDAIASPTADSCTKQLLVALVSAEAALRASQGDDAQRWAWGAQHRLKLRPLFPNTALDLPSSGPGFAKTGDNFVVNRSDQGWRDLDFSQFADGPAQRFVAISEGRDRPLRVRWAIPGGVIYDSRSPHYSDLLDLYLREEHFAAPYADYAELLEVGESRWVFR